MTWPWRRTHKTPVPGGRPPPQTAPPAPALPRRHGGIAHSIRMWKCGRIRMWDGTGELIWAEECDCPSGADWHQWESEMSET